MAHSDVDAYLAAAPEFARPILKTCRRLWGKAAPQAKEVMKWGAPCIEGRGLIGGMAAFQRHVSLTLWNARDVAGAETLFPATGRMPKGNLKVASVADLPPEATLLKLFREAARLDAAGASVVMATAPRVVTPRDLGAAIRAAPKAASTYAALSPSGRREYVEWIVEAKRESTRLKRIAQAVDWLAEGKERNWRYR